MNDDSIVTHMHCHVLSVLLTGPEKKKKKKKRKVIVKFRLSLENWEHNKCLNGEMLHFSPLNELISNLMPATDLKKVGMGQKRAEKARHFEKIQLGEHLATN